MEENSYDGGKKKRGPATRQDEWMKEQMVKREVRERAEENETDGIELVGRADQYKP